MTCRSQPPHQIGIQGRFQANCGKPRRVFLFRFPTWFKTISEEVDKNLGDVERRYSGTGSGTPEWTRGAGRRSEIAFGGRGP